MRAAVGDRLVIKGHHSGEPDRDAEVLEVRGENGAPPWPAAEPTKVPTGRSR